MTTQTSTTRLASSPRLSNPAAHIIAIIPIPQPSIIMAIPLERRLGGRAHTLLCQAPGMQTKTGAMTELWRDA